MTSLKIYIYISPLNTAGKMSHALRRTQSQASEGYLCVWKHSTSLWSGLQYHSGRKKNKNKPSIKWWQQSSTQRWFLKRGLSSWWAIPLHDADTHLSRSQKPSCVQGYWDERFRFVSEIFDSSPIVVLTPPRWSASSMSSRDTSPSPSLF